MTAVDNSDEMLAYVPSGAHAVKADIEELRLPATFDVVLLASRLINHEDHDVRAAFIRTAAMHLTHLGKFVLERHWACASLGNPLDPSIEWTA